MVDSSILVITYLFFYGMIGLTIINVALIIALAILLSKQQKKINHSALPSKWFILTFFSGNHFVVIIFYLY